MSTNPNESGFVKYENRANQAYEHAHQNIHSNNNNNVFNCCPVISPVNWNRKKKTILGISILLIVIIVAVVPVSLKVPSHHENQPSNTATETQITPAVAPTGTQTSPQTFSASGTSTIAPSSVATSATSNGTLPPPPSPTADGIHLMNALDGTLKSSGFAWYASAVNGNNGAQPNDYANTTTTNVYAEWENQNRTALFTRTNTFTWAFINSTNAPVNKAVGEASNGYRSFVCYKDNGRLLFKQNGSDFDTEYYCQ